MSQSESPQEMEKRRQLSGIDKAISFVSPTWALQRVVARENLHQFSAVKRSSARGRPATLNDQGSSESWRKQRERIDAMMEGREMEENFCVIAGLIQKLGLHIAGQLEYQPETGDRKINAEYSDYFHDWCGRADYAGRHRFRTMVQLGVQSAIRDGQHGWVEKVIDGELRLQMIEGDRIGNPQNPSNADEKNINGIRIGDRGEVLAYEIYKRTRTTQYEKEADVTPDDFIHLFFPNRTDQYHGVSKLAPALPHARDLYEILGYEKIGAKFSAQFAAFIRTKDKGAPGSADWSDSTPGSGLPATMKAQAGTVLKLETGVEEIEFAPGVQRPSGAFMALLEALIREIALAMNLPYGFVYNLAALGGVTARLETQQAQRTFRWYQGILEHILLNRVKRKVLLFAIASGRLRSCKNWDKGSWRYGQSLTGDIGFQVQADLDLVRGGYKTRSQLAADYNNDFAQTMEQKGSEIQIAMEVSKRTGVPIELLLSDLDNPTGLIAALERAKSGAPDPSAAPPPPPGLIGTVGDKGVKSLLDMVMAVNRGEMDRDSGINTAMISYGMPFSDADALFPKDNVMPPVENTPAVRPSRPQKTQAR